jgi:Spy/CpxP family protein refolding chaperone
MKKNWFVAGFVLVLLLSSTVLARQQGLQRQGRQGKGGMWQSLDLNDEQQKKLLDMRLELQKEMLPLRTDMQDLRSQLKLELTKDEFNENQVKKLTEQIASIGQQIQLKRILHQRAVRNILTPEQRKIYDFHILSSSRFRENEGFMMPAGPEPPRRPARFMKDTD